MVVEKGTKMRSTSIIYTCDRCQEKTPEKRIGFYPSDWTRLNLFHIERNIEIVKNHELCSKCSNELNKWLYPQQIEEPIEEPKDAPA